MEKIYDVAKRNWIFVVFIVVVLLVFSRRYNYLTASVVSFPDDQIVFSIRYLLRSGALRVINSPRNPATNSCVPIIMDVSER